MDDTSARKFQKELNSGLVSLVLLAVLASSRDDLYGYEIAKRLQRANEGEPLFKEGTIYPVLRALAAAGWLDSHVVPSTAGPPCAGCSAGGCSTRTCATPIRTCSRRRASTARRLQRLPTDLRVTV